MGNCKNNKCHSLGWIGLVFLFLAIVAVCAVEVRKVTSKLKVIEKKIDMLGKGK